MPNTDSWDRSHLAVSDELAREQPPEKLQLAVRNGGPGTTILIDRSGRTYNLNMHLHFEPLNLVARLAPPVPGKQSARPDSTGGGAKCKRRAPVARG